MDMKLIRREPKIEFEKAQLDVEIAKQSMDYATTEAHFEIACERVTVAEKKLNLAYKESKIIGGLKDEEINNTDGSYWAGVANDIVSRWRGKKARETC